MLGPVVIGVRMTYVRPSTYTKGIDPLYDADNVIAHPTGAKPKGRLLLWLGGTSTIPKMYQYVVAVAALHGFNAIALEYPNLREVNALCRTSRDPDCWGDIRNEIFTGRSTSRLVKVDATNSIQQRLVDLLQYLRLKDPSGGWNAFLAGDRARWSSITIGGHSQGAGDAAYISKYRRLAGDCPIESPADGNPNVATAAWLSVSPQTPPRLGYGFGNELDSFANFGTMVLDWTTLGFAGPQTDVDDVKPPYFRSHQLFTVKQFRGPLNSHDYPIMDYVTPLDAKGVPVFAPIWSYICGLD